MGQKASAIQISVIISAYNYADLLPRAVKSVIPQLTPHHELIIVDDGSTDNTHKVIEQLSAEFPHNFYAYRKENGGSASARNFGIEKSKGNYLVFLDADDELSSQALNSFTQHIMEHPETRMVIGGHTSIFPNGELREHLPLQLPQSALERVRKYLIDKKITLSNGACAMHREIFERASYPEKFRSAEDVPIFAQTLAHYPCTILPQTVAIIYKHDDSLRHQFIHAKAGGLALVDEVFSPERLGHGFESLKGEFYAQRCLSLFRSAYLAGDAIAAKEYFKKAFQQNKRILLKGSYLRKAMRLLFGS